MASGPSSVGIELEFIIGLKVGDRPLDKPRMFQNSPGSPIIIEPTDDTQDIIRMRVKEVIEAAVEGHKGDRVVTSAKEVDEVEGDVNAFHLKKYMEWGVIRDVTVTVPDHIVREDPIMDEYIWEDVEVYTPALFATDKSWAEIHRVVTALNKNFWIIVPESAGLHVHYGRGKQWISPSHFRNLAAFLYAADPILAQMHPEHRRGLDNFWCESNRLYSVLAHGATGEEASQVLKSESRGFHSALIQLTSLEAPGSESELPPPQVIPSGKSARDFVSIFRRGSLEGYTTFSELRFLATIPSFMRRGQIPLMFTSEEGESNEPLGIVNASQELFSTAHPSVISYLMSLSSASRLAYNFNAYKHTTYKVVETDGARNVICESQPKRTVEFRQPAGTMNPEEVVAHGKVVVRICDIAANKSTEDLWKLILDFAQGETHGS
ncbi:putative amidoligase enzyme-domain-containing protein [Hypoxylon sp. FL0890]|nr:putative amidoligase enzyme-domain-containing protein [Hypoxylon sp. FL0890]